MEQDTNGKGTDDEKDRNNGNKDSNNQQRDFMFINLT
jgi:hypothetical protein